MQSNFYYGNFEKHNGHSHFDLPSYSEYLNHCNNSQHYNFSESIKVSKYQAK